MARSPGARFMLLVAAVALPLVSAIRDSFETDTLGLEVGEESKEATYKRDYFKTVVDLLALLDEVPPQKAKKATSVIDWAEDLALDTLGVELVSASDVGMPGPAIVKVVHERSVASAMLIREGWRLAFIGDLDINRTADVAIIRSDLRKVLSRRKRSKKPFSKKDCPLLLQVLGVETLPTSADLPQQILLKFDKEPELPELRLPVKGEIIELDLKKEAHLSHLEGLGVKFDSDRLVEAVDAYSDAERMGIENGWMLTYIGGAKINTTKDIKDIFSGLQQVFNSKDNPLQAKKFPLLLKVFHVDVTVVGDVPELSAELLPNIVLKFKKGEDIIYYTDHGVGHCYCDGRSDYQHRFVGVSECKSECDGNSQCSGYAASNSGTDCWTYTCGKLQGYGTGRDNVHCHIKNPEPTKRVWELDGEQLDADLAELQGLQDETHQRYIARIQMFKKQLKEARDKLSELSRARGREADLPSLKERIPKLQEVIESVTTQTKGTWDERKVAVTDQTLKQARSRLTVWQMRFTAWEECEKAMAEAKEHGDPDVLRAAIMKAQPEGSVVDILEYFEIKPYQDELEKLEAKEAKAREEGLITVVKQAEQDWAALGVVVKPCGDVLEVVSIVKGSVIDLYNNVSATKLVVTDLITFVNGRRKLPYQQMTEQLRWSTKVRIFFKPNPRAKEFAVKVWKTKEPKRTWTEWLGIEADIHADVFGDVITIKKIQGGPIKRHNRNADDSQVVREGDRVMAVNGERLRVVSELERAAKGATEDATEVIVDIVHPKDLADRAERRSQFTVFHVALTPREWLTMGTHSWKAKETEPTQFIKATGKRPRLPSPKDGAYLFRPFRDDDHEDVWLHVEDIGKVLRKRAVENFEDIFQKWLQSEKKDVEAMRKALKECEENGVRGGNIPEAETQLKEELGLRAKASVADLVEQWAKKKKKKSEAEFDSLKRALQECHHLGVMDSQISRAKVLVKEETAETAAASEHIRSPSPRTEETDGVAESTDEPKTAKDFGADFMVAVTRQSSERGCGALGFSIDTATGTMMTIKDISEDTDSDGKPIYSIHAHNTRMKRNSDKVREGDIIVAVRDVHGVDHKWQGDEKERNEMFRALEVDLSVTIVFKKRSKETDEAAKPKLPTPQDFGGHLMVTLKRPTVPPKFHMESLGIDIDELSGEIRKIFTEPRLPVYSYNHEKGRRHDEKVRKGDFIVAVRDNKGVFHVWETEKAECTSLIEDHYGKEVTIVLKHPESVNMMRFKKAGNLKLEQFQNWKLKRKQNHDKGQRDDRSLSSSPSLSSVASSSSGGSAGPLEFQMVGTVQ